LFQTGKDVPWNKHHLKIINADIIDRGIILTGGWKQCLDALINSFAEATKSSSIFNWQNNLWDSVAY